MQTAEVQQLVQQCLDGHQSAMGELVERYRAMVYGLCYRMLGQREDAEDVTQETFFRVLNNLDRWDPTRKFEPWLLTIAGNRCRTSLAKRRRHPATHSLDYPLADHRGESAAATQLAEEVALVLAEVRDDYRRAFMLFHRDELSYQEISEKMNVPLGTVKTWVHRARQELIGQLRQRGAIAGGGSQ